MVETKFHIDIKDINYGYYSMMFDYVKSIDDFLSLVANTSNEIGRSLEQIVVLVDANKCSSNALITVSLVVYIHSGKLWKRY